MKLFTSIPEKVSRRVHGGEEIGLSWTRACIASWQKAGYQVVSLNSATEALSVRKLHQDIEVIEVVRDGSAVSGRPLVYVSDLIYAMANSQDNSVAVANADVMLFEDAAIKLNSWEPDGFAYSNRLDIDDPSGKNPRPHWGVDYLIVNVRHLSNLQVPNFLFGTPWWGYWLPIVLMGNGVKGSRLSLNGFPVIVHVAHEDHWNETDFIENSSLFMRSLINLTENRFSRSSNLYEVDRKSRLPRSSNLYEVDRKSRLPRPLLNIFLELAQSLSSIIHKINHPLNLNDAYFLSVRSHSANGTKSSDLVSLDAFEGIPVTSSALESLQSHGKTAWHSICFVGTCYNAFIDHHYRVHPNLLQASYQTQLKALLDTGFGDADFYSQGISAAGWNASDVIANCMQLQTAWAHEHGFKGDLVGILVEQMRRLNPDVIYLQDLSLATSDILACLRPHARLIVGQIASPIPTTAYLQGFDVLVSSFPHFVERFRKAGICSYYQPLAFDPRILARLGPRNPCIPFSFVGGISGLHAKGTQLLANVAAMTPMQVWGYGAGHLVSESLLRQRHRGEAWGLEMFRLLHSSRITFNRHIDTAERFANNMRLFEATGMGALLITDYKDNLVDLFRVGEEVIAYRSAEECSDLVGYYLAHPDEADAIALAGQTRTLKDHTYERRMAHTAEILDRHLRQPETRSHFGNPGNISYGYQNLSDHTLQPELSQAWKHPAIPARQRALVELQLEELYHGRTNPVFQVLADLLSAIVPSYERILEIGCSSGYYYEILEYLLNRRLNYVGVDYSEDFIEMARNFYPKAHFEIADGAVLPFKDNFFPCVISSCILLHVPNFREHIRETARVARDYVVAHRTPICRKRPNQVMKKLAYEVETIELRFNEAEFIQAFMEEGLILDKRIEYSRQLVADEFEVSYRFRFEHVLRPELIP